MEATELIETLTARGETLGVAESLTGGRLAATLTAVPGSSEVFVGGVVSYATRVKTSLLGVPDGVVAEHGVVSAACARAMAEGVRTLLDTTWALATTGVAGPGPADGVAAGTVYVALSGPGGTQVRELGLAGDRSAVRGQSVGEALTLLSGRLAREEPRLG